MSNDGDAVSKQSSKKHVPHKYYNFPRRQGLRRRNSIAEKLQNLGNLNKNLPPDLAMGRNSTAPIPMQRPKPTPESQPVSEKASETEQTTVAKKSSLNTSMSTVKPKPQTEAKTFRPRKKIIYEIEYER